MQKKHLIGAGITAFSVILGLLWLIPLIWLIGTAFSVPSFHMTLFPTTAFTLDNIKYVWNAIPFGTYYINTLTLVVCTFAVQFFTSTLAAYALAVLDFKGQALVFAVIFMQIIIPNDVLITPNFMTLSDLKLIDTKIGGSKDRRCQHLADHLGCIHAMCKTGISFLCRYLCQLPLEQLPVASDRDQLSYQPYTDRRTCYFRKIQRG